MDSIVILVATLVLAIVASALRGPPGVKPVRAAAAFVVGLGLTAAGVKGAAHVFQMYPDDELASFAAHVVDEQDERPTIVFLGTSMSAYEIDEDMLTDELADLGYDVRAASLSIEGASQQERDMTLRQYLRATDKPPKVLLIEISYPTDAQSWYAFTIGKFSKRAIKQFGPRGLFWSLRGYFGEAGPEGVYENGRVVTLFGLHAALANFNVGFLRDARPLSAVEPEEAFDPQTETRPSLPAPEEIVEGLSTDDAEPVDAPFPWAVAFRRVQTEYALEAGVGEVAFYMPPTISPGRRAYFEAACAAQGDYVCISPNDPALLDQLTPDLWQDERHLLEPGAEIYTDWLARELVASGLLNADGDVESTRIATRREGSDSR